MNQCVVALFVIVSPSLVLLSLRHARNRWGFRAPEAKKRGASGNFLSHEHARSPAVRLDMPVNLFGMACSYPINSAGRSTTTRPPALAYSTPVTV